MAPWLIYCFIVILIYIERKGPQNFQKSQLKWKILKHFTRPLLGSHCWELPWEKSTLWIWAGHLWNQLTTICIIMYYELFYPFFTYFKNVFWFYIYIYLYIIYIYIYIYIRIVGFVFICKIYRHLFIYNFSIWYTPL